MNAQDLEGQVIGSLLNGGASPDAYEVLSFLPEEAFSIPAYRLAYVEIKRQALSKNIIDLIMISDALGGDSFANLAEAGKNNWSSANLKGYATLVRKAWHKRRVIEIVGTAHREIEQSRASEHSDSIIASLVAQLSEIAADQSTVVPVHMKDLLDNYLGELEARQSGKEHAQTIKFGMENFDRKVGGLNPTDLMILAARPSMGKTEYALSMLRGVTEDGGGALMFSMEMTSGQITERNIAGSGGLSVRKLKNPEELHDEDWARISNGVADMTGTLKIDSTTERTAVYRGDIGGISIYPATERFALANNIEGLAFEKFGANAHRKAVMIYQSMTETDADGGNLRLSAWGRDSMALLHDGFIEMLNTERMPAAPVAH